MKSYPLERPRNAALYREALQRTPESGPVLTFHKIRGGPRGVIGVYTKPIVVFKKVLGLSVDLYMPNLDEFIAVLLIPKGILVRRPDPSGSHFWGAHKCRAAEAVCLGFLQVNRARLARRSVTNGQSRWITHTLGKAERSQYVLGEKCLPDSFNGYAWKECAGGIHYFESLVKARQY